MNRAFWLEHIQPSIKRDTRRWIGQPASERRRRIYDHLTRTMRGLPMKTGKKADRFIWPNIEFRFQQLDLMAGVVYRIYDANDELLYIGFTSNLDTRLKGHKTESVWWPLARTVRGAHISRDTSLPREGNVQNRDMRRRGLAEEARLIRKLQPRFNTVGKTIDSRIKRHTT